MIKTHILLTVFKFVLAKLYSSLMGQINSNKCRAYFTVFNFMLKVFHNKPTNCSS